MQAVRDSGHHLQDSAAQPMPGILYPEPSAEGEQPASQTVWVQHEPPVAEAPWSTAQLTVLESVTLPWNAAFRRPPHLSMCVLGHRTHSLSEVNLHKACKATHWSLQSTQTVRCCKPLCSFAVSRPRYKPQTLAQFYARSRQQEMSYADLVKRLRIEVRKLYAARDNVSYCHVQSLAAVSFRS